MNPRVHKDWLYLNPFVDKEYNTLSTVFRYKFWSCCRKRTTDFDEFLKQEGCTSGSHRWELTEEVGDIQIDMFVVIFAVQGPFMSCNGQSIMKYLYLASYIHLDFYLIDVFLFAGKREKSIMSVRFISNFQAPLRSTKFKSLCSPLSALFN